MAKELIIQTSSTGADIALLEDRRLTELHHENVSEEFLVGDIYIGRIRKVLPSLNAAFVDIGHERDAFLHYHDLGPNIRSLNRFVDLARKNKLRDERLAGFRFEPEIVKTGKVEEVFTANQTVMVQIVKEPISTKGPRLSSQVSLSGRYLILIPFNDQVSLSKKLKGKQERERLRKLLGEIKPRNFGIIVRTNAEGAADAELQADLNKLLDDWDNLVKALLAGKQKLYSELSRTSSLLRDMVNSDFSRITVDSQKLYKQVKGYLHSVSQSQEEIVKLYKSDRPLFDQLDINRQIKSLFNRIVNLGGGAYLVIEHTEAMHVIDVNSGSKRSKEEDQEGAALRTNTEAAGEIARQLRLRDMGGIIVIDFIDMRKQNNRKVLFERMRDAMKDDRAKHTILPLSKFGLMQITRQRVRQELVMDSSEPCPVCAGTGQVNKGILVTDDIKLKIEEAIKERGKKSLTLKVHPFVHAYLTHGMFSERVRWFFTYGWRIGIEPADNFHLNQFEIE